MLYFECKMGAAGDMIMGALYDLLNDEQKIEFIAKMNSIFPKDIVLKPETSSKCGINGIHMHVETLGVEESCEFHHSHDHHHHHHYSYSDILSKVDSFSLPDKVKNDIKSIYTKIGQAEAKVHNTTLEQIHFHEVGSLDAIADVTGCALAISYLNPDRILCSPIHVGNGLVRCAHGILPVPTPATAEILRGIPIYTGGIDSELCTPTGAAILSHFVDAFTHSMPIQEVKAIGYGLGHKDFPMANLVRVMLTASASQNQDDQDQILDLSCNIDDMTGEELGFAMDRILSLGALDVYYTPIYMKKNRPGILLHVLCPIDKKELFAQAILKHTTTRGLRYQIFDRMKLVSTFDSFEYDGTTVHNKQSSGYGVKKQKLEFEDIKEYALAHDLSIIDARQLLMQIQK